MVSITSGFDGRNHGVSPRNKLNRWREVCLFLILASSPMYLSRLTQLSPVYLFQLFATILLIPTINAKFIRVTKKKDVFLALILLAYLVATNIFSPLNGTSINIYLGLVSYISVRYIGECLESRKTLKAFKYATVVTVVLLFTDTLIRLMHPTPPNPDYTLYVSQTAEFSRYVYKFGGYMFSDSNTTGLVALVFLLTYLDVKKYASKTSQLEVSLIVICILSFSLSVAITIVVVYFGKYITAKTTTRNAHLKFTSFAFATVSVFLISQQILSDVSFASKFYIWNLVYQHLQDISFSNFLFGVGLGNAKSTLGIHPHILLTTYLVETGIIGASVFTVFVAHIFLRYKSWAVFGIMLASLSYFLYLGAPFLFAPLALVPTLKTFKVFTQKNTTNHPIGTHRR